MLEKFVPPWKKYSKVASLVKKGDIEGAFARKELSWLEGDIDGWINMALNKPGDFDSGMVRAMDAIAGTRPDDSSLEARIYQRWSQYPQIKAMLNSTGISRSMMIDYIRDKIKAKQTKE